MAVVLALLATGCGGGGGGSEPDATPTADSGGAAVVPDGECEDRTLVAAEDNLAGVERATLCLVNGERLERGRAPLEPNEALSRAARRKARHMVENDYFAHVGPDGRDVRDWVSDTAYLEGARRYRLGENLGWASEGAATPAQIVEQWMNSEGHRENLLREDFEDSGIGVALGAPRAAGGGGATYVHVFGAR